MGRAGDEAGACELCGRIRPLTFHHLIPRANHGNKWFRKRFSRDEMRGRGAWLCRACHDKVHELFDEKTLGRTFNRIEALRAEPEVARFVAWVRKRP